jgi:hypothetical protein
VKAFRGTLIAAVVLAVVVGLVWWLDPAPELVQVQEDVPLFRFEKPELVRVVIHRPGDELVLAEQEDGSWIVEGPGWPAARSMVNRVKHQIHDLNARATVIDSPEAPELYGLGENAIKVELFFRDGEQLSFLAGDPNPSAVSFYIQPLSGDAAGGLVYTVKKSALDYYSLEPSEFRERRFATHDANDADRIEAELPGGRRLVLQRTGPFHWQIEEPIQYPASREEVRRLLGRVTALKARAFVEDHPEDLARYGLEQPRAHVVIKFASREPIDLIVGDQAEVDDSIGRPRSYAYMKLADDFTVYTGPDDFLEDYLIDPQELRLRKLMRMRVGEVTDVVVDLRAAPGEDLEGSVVMMYRADKWLWGDGVPVPGSTPSRVALRAAEIQADGIVAEEPGPGDRYGFERPRLTVQLTDQSGAVRTLIVGDETEPEVDPEGRERRRFFARCDDHPAVYRVDEGVLDVAEDAVREYQRKAGHDADKEQRHRRMEEALGELPSPRASAVPAEPAGATEP